MTRFFILTTTVLLMILFGMQLKTVNKQVVSEKSAIGIMATQTTSDQNLDTHGKTIPGNAGTTSPIHTENHSKTPVFDETPHIHHFHKERMKKMTKHHNKLWYLSQLLLVVCQFSLLVIAYLHISH